MGNRLHGAGLGVLVSVFLCAAAWGQGAQAPRVSGQGDKTLRLFVNGAPVDEKAHSHFAPPRLRGSTLYIPLCAVFTSYSVIESGDTVTMTVGDKSLRLTDGKRDIVVNGQPLELSAPVRRLPTTGRDHSAHHRAVPADFFQKAFGGQVTHVDDRVDLSLPRRYLSAASSPPPTRPTPMPRRLSRERYSSPQRTYVTAGTAAGSVLFLVMFVLLLIGIAIAVQVSQRNALNNVYRQFAQQVGGTLQEGSLWSFPSVAFARGGAAALLDIYSTGGKNSTHYTQLTFTFYYNSSFRCEVYPEGFLQEIGKFFGMQDIEVGYRVFDDHFVVKSDDIETVKNFLNAAVQQELLKLKRLRGNDHVYLSMNSSRLLIKKLSLFNRFEDLLAFYESGGRICDELLTLLGDNGAGAIQILEVSLDGTEQAPTCQICGESITAEKVVCRRCRTPHHHDCWEYNGGCSVYACKERRYVVSS